MPLEGVVLEGGVIVGGVLLPAGTIIGVNAWVTHGGKIVYGKDAGNFSREVDRSRAGTLENNGEMILFCKRNPNPSLFHFYFCLDFQTVAVPQFWSRHKNIYGMNIFLIETEKLVARFLREFDITCGGPEECKTTTFWFAKQTGFYVKLHPR